MDILGPTLIACYSAVLAIVCLYGFHRYWVVWTLLRNRDRIRELPPSEPPAKLPSVTVQLPMYNERHVARRAIETACAIDYPRELLQVQVLDDSTDESAGEARRCCLRMAAAGYDIQYVHRDDRRGFKAGALAAGMERASGEFIAIFDADFVPPPDVLRKSIGHFADPGLGMVQMRWGHLNRGESLLTEIQALFLDGHFVVEQTARAAAGRWFNFNGTAGVWRRTCIEDAGGWTHDTLTEDTDLSYRAQLRGWRFLYLPALTCPAELPPTVGAFMTQQHRWNKGLTQTAIKLLPRILAGRAPWPTKLEAFFHLTSPLVNLATVGLAILGAAMLLVPWRSEGPGLAAPFALALGAAMVMLGLAAACIFYVTSQTAQGRGALRAIGRLPALLALGIGISLNNARGVVGAMLRRPSPFVRTPKFAGSRRGLHEPAAKGRRRGGAELALGALMAACFVVAVLRPHTLIGAPFMLLFACGYLGLGIPGCRRAWEEANKRRPDRAPGKRKWVPVTD